MALQVGNVTFNETQILRQLRQDLRDDWFPDPLLYKDMIDGQERHVLQGILSNVERNHGRYTAAKRFVYNLPKPNFTLRYALEVSLGDRALYHALVANLIPLFDPLIPWNSFSHRPNRSHKNGSLFERGVVAWKHFVGSTRSALQPGMTLLSADISNYYENIDLKRLRATLESIIPLLNATGETKSSVRSHIDLLFDCLGSWAFDVTRGLPQNRDASSFLANLYLRDVDLAMRNFGYSDRYFRYMDDIRIVCNDPFEARRALKQLSIALRDVGLALNAKKTDICDASNSAKLNEHLREALPEVQHLDTLWNTRNREVILWSAEKLKNLTVDLIKTNQMESKDFRFCILRLEALALCSEFVVPAEFFKDVTPAILQGLIDAPSSTEYFARYLQAVPISESDLSFVADHLVDTARAIYSWQNFHLWTVLARKNFRPDNLVQNAAMLISAERDTATRAGASVYLGCVGDVSRRRLIAEKFRDLESFIGQRCALVATHELPFKPDIEKSVKPFVRPDLVGVYKNLQSRRGHYFSPIERRPLSSFVDRERVYD